MMDLGLAGKRAVVTGASKGIGFAVAQLLAREGCVIDIAARNGTALAAAREIILKATPGAEVRVHGADLSTIEDQDRLAQACADADILVNNAGAVPSGSLDETATPCGATRGI